MKTRIQKFHFNIRQYPGDDCPEDEFRFDAEISNKNLDAYFSTMDDTSLDNYVSDINNGGVALLNSHNYSDLRSVIGKWTNAKRDGDSVIATATMLRSNDKTPDDLNVDEIIRRVEKGFYTDVSVGFHGSREICNICDKPIFDYRSKDRCEHWPGELYDGVQCTYEVRDAHLAEASLVYDGATPGAMVINARNAPEELVNWKRGTPDATEATQILVDYGKKYQIELIDKLIEEKVRTIGHDFDEERDRAKYLLWPVEDVMEQIAVYQKAQNYTGGRKINDQPSLKEQLNYPRYLFG